MLSRAFVLLIAGSVPAIGQVPLSAEEFDQHTTGKTFFYGRDGVAYGVEEYLENRRVRWSFLDGECIEGEWYPDGDDICFVYENREGAECWQVFLDNGRLSARVATDPVGEPLYEVEQSAEPMFCPGPRIGV
ncbi:MAG: hypothetical protein AAGH83_10205 [Pseudomonadota bacterium]